MSELHPHIKGVAPFHLHDVPHKLMVLVGTVVECEQAGAAEPRGVKVDGCVKPEKLRRHPAEAGTDQRLESRSRVQAVKFDVVEGVSVLDFEHRGRIEDVGPATREVTEVVDLEPSLSWKVLWLSLCELGPGPRPKHRP